MAEYRLTPRYTILPWSAIIGGAIAAALLVMGGSLGFAAVSGIAALCGIAYLRSPTWKIKILTSATTITFAKPKSTASLPWSEVRKVLVDPVHGTALLVGPDAATSLIIPGVGAPAPYDIASKKELLAEVRSHVSATRQREVESVEQAIADKLPWQRDEEPVE